MRGLVGRIVADGLGFNAIRGRKQPLVWSRWQSERLPVRSRCSRAGWPCASPPCPLSPARPSPRVLQGTMLVALLQPSPETFELFDDVMLLASGMVSGLRAQYGCALLPGPQGLAGAPSFEAPHSNTLCSGRMAPDRLRSSPAPCPCPLPAPPPQILYHGPREGVLPFFRSHLGFDCPPRKGVADFLQEIALPSDQQVGAGIYHAGWADKNACPKWNEGCLAWPRPVIFSAQPANLLPSSAPLLPPALQKYWADNTRPYSYVTAQTIRKAFWESKASEPQRLMLAAPPAQHGVGGEGDTSSALTTSK